MHNGSLYPADELYHFKYIFKEPKGNGKYRYYYKGKTINGTSAVFQKIEGSPDSKYGTYRHGTKGDYEYRTFTTREGLFNDSKTFTFDGQSHKITQYGYVSQTIEAGKRFVSDLWTKLFK